MKSGKLRVAQAVTSAEPLVVLAVFPALLFPSPSRLAALAVVPLVWACARVSTGRILPRSPLNTAMVSLMLMAGVSLAATFDASYSLAKVCGLLAGILFFWAIVRWTTTARRLWLMLGGFLFLAAAIAVLGLLGTKWFDKFPALGGAIARLPKAVRGVSGAEQGFHPNEVAGVLILFVPLQFALLVTGVWRSMAPGLVPKLGRIPLIAWESLALVLSVLTLVLTQSRGAWMGIAVAAAAFFAWWGKRSRVLVVLVLAAVILAAAIVGPAQVLDLAISRTGPGMVGNLSGRIDLWSKALRAIQDYPLTGMGMNVFRRAMPVLYPIDVIAPEFDIAHAHNHLLQAALDVGIPGLVAYLAIWMVAATQLVWTYRRSRDRTYTIVAGGLGAGLIAHFCFGMTDAVALGAKAGVLFWLALSLVASLHQVALASTLDEAAGSES